MHWNRWPKSHDLQNFLKWLSSRELFAEVAYDIVLTMFISLYALFVVVSCFSLHCVCRYSAFSAWSSGVWTLCCSCLRSSQADASRRRAPHQQQPPPLPPKQLSTTDLLTVTRLVILPDSVQQIEKALISQNLKKTFRIQFCYVGK